jgi:hypothetical protein
MLHHELIYEFTLASDDNEKWEVITARFPPVVIPAHAEIQVLFSRISLDTR